MNYFTIETIQTAISFLPFLICFTMMFRRKVGKYWVLPMIALAGNIAYRVHELYLVRHSTEVLIPPDLVIAFAPSMINLVLFLGLLSIQISQLRGNDSAPPEAMKLLEGPRDRSAGPPLNTKVQPAQEKPPASIEPEPAVQSYGPIYVPPKEENPPVSEAAHPVQEPSREEERKPEPGGSEDGVKKKPYEPQDISVRIQKIRVPEDPEKRAEMNRQISVVKGSLLQVLELAQYNGQLKKPRKRKKVPKKRTRKAAT